MQQRQPQVGDIIEGKFRLEQVLGKGGMGVVFQARLVGLERRVAIKFWIPDPSNPGLSRESVERSRREALIGASMLSEHTVRVEQVGALEDGTPFLVMEMLQGLDLGALLTRRRKEGAGPLEWGVACDYMLDVCEALAEAHTRGIIHRDLKPSNIFLAHKPNGQRCVKLLDFGISKVVGGSIAQAEKLTGTQMLLGSVLYMSPEQCKSATRLDFRADVWSLGATFYRLLTGRLPFEGENTMEVYSLIVSDKPAPPLLERLPQAPPALASLVDSCLRKNPSERPPSVMAVAEALAPLCPSGPERLAAIQALLENVHEDMDATRAYLPAGTPGLPPFGGREPPADHSQSSTPRPVSISGHAPLSDVRPLGRGAFAALATPAAIALVGTGWWLGSARVAPAAPALTAAAAAGPAAPLPTASASAAVVAAVSAPEAPPAPAASSAAGPPTNTTSKPPEGKKPAGGVSPAGGRPKPPASTPTAPLNALPEGYVPE